MRVCLSANTMSTDIHMLTQLGHDITQLGPDALPMQKHMMALHISYTIYMVQLND